MKTNLLNRLSLYRILLFCFAMLCTYSNLAAQQAPPKQWDKTFGGSNFDYFTSMIATHDGGFLLGGYSESDASGDKSENSKGSYDYWIVKIDMNGNKLWDKTFGGSNYDHLNSMITTPDGGYLLGGPSDSDTGGDKSQNSNGGNYEYDYWILKIDANGNKLWDKTIGGSNIDALRSMVATSDGGYLLGGRSTSNISGDKSEDNNGDAPTSDYWIVKVDANGNKQWDKTFGGSDYDELYSMIATPDGGYLLGGYSVSNISGDKSENSRGYDDYWIVKVDANGNKLWDKTIGGSDDDIFTSMITTTDGGYLLAGYSWSNISSDKSEDSKGYNDYWIVKIGANGNKLWDKTIGGSSSDGLRSMAATSDGGYLLGGISYSDISGDKSEDSRGDIDYWVVKIDANGNKLWDKTIGGNRQDFLTKMILTIDGNYLLGGYSYSDASFDKSEPNIGLVNTSTDYWIIKIDTEGNKIWDKTIGFYDSSDELEDMLLLNDGSYILGGSSETVITEFFEEKRGGFDFWIVKLINPNKLSGTVFNSQNTNCTQETNEKGLAGWTIKAQSDTIIRYAITDSLGKYTLSLDSATYVITQIPPTDGSFELESQICPNSSYTITFSGYGKDTTGFNFASKAKECALLKVDVTSTSRRRCFANETFITYCNTGTKAVENAEVKLVLPEYLIPISSTLPWISQEDSVYTFAVGNLAAGECGGFILTDSIACVSDITGLSQCMEARIYPPNTCIPGNSQWNGANLEVWGFCAAYTDNLSIAAFLVKNTGDGAMTAPVDYRFFVNDTLVYEDILFFEGDSTFLGVPANIGNNIRIEIDQVPLNPYNTKIYASVIGCGTSSDTTSTGSSNDFAQNDQANYVEIDCQEIVDSFDPNDKLVSPIGITENHIVAPNTELEYIIRFQNTGTAEAINIYLIDTLSTYLDIESLKTEAASHAYSYEILQNDPTVIAWAFENIYLPDSTTNEPESHGFVKFKIKPLTSTPLGTKIENFADIYFDFNDPVRTNTTLTTIDNYQYPTQEIPCLLIGSTPDKPSILQGTQDTLRSSETGDKYEWFFNGTALSFNTRSIKATQSGNYEVKVTKNGCVSAKSAIFAYTITALNEFERLSKVQVFPNPTQGKLQIRMENPLDKEVTLTLTNATGTVVWQRTYKTNTQDEWKEELNFGNFGKGLYFLQIQNSKGFSVKKVVLE